MKTKSKSQLIAELEAAHTRLAELEQAVSAGATAEKMEQEKIARLLEVLPVGVSILNAERQVVYQNPALSRILDITAEGFSAGTYKNRKYLSADGTPMSSGGFASIQAEKTASRSTMSKRES